MNYSDQVIEQVQSLNDIVEVISGYLPLKRAGRTFKACCPFHHEKTPSFFVHPEKQIFHCFGCSAGGDVFSFLMKYEQMTFPEALRRLAERAHVDLPAGDYTSRRERSQTERLYQIYVLAAEFYHARLKDKELGASARAYLANRDFGSSEIETFRIGYASADWRMLLEFLLKKGFKEDELFLSGLVLRSQQGTPYDLFRNRIVFPIHNSQGKIVAFGGRVLGDEMPKYINSPESSIFKKRKELYALHAARQPIRTSGEIRRVLVVEGYLDCIRLHAAGFQNAVATLGTSLTEEHIRILKRYADEAVMIYDGDKAGEQASLRVLDLFLEEDFPVRVLCLPAGYDPDEFIKDKGRSEMEKLLGSAQEVFDFKLKMLLARYNKADSVGLLKITSEFLDTLARIRNPVLLDRYLKRLAATLGVEENSLRLELGKLRKKQAGKPAGEQVVIAEKRERRADPPVEVLLLSLSLHHFPYWKTFRNLFPDYQFMGERTQELTRLFGTLMNERDADQFSVSQLLSKVTEERLKGFVSELLMMRWDSGQDREQAFQDCLRKFATEARTSQLKLLRGQISKAEESGDQEKVLSLMRFYQEVLSAKPNP